MLRGTAEASQVGPADGSGAGPPARHAHDAPAGAVRAAAGAVAATMAVAYVALVAPLVGVGRLLDGRPPGFDASLTRRLGSWRGGLLDPVSSGFSQLSEPMTVVGTVAGAVIVLLVLHRSALAVSLLVALPLELAVFLTVAAVVGRDRPAIEPLDPEPFTSSFPSGHTAAAVALHGSLAWIVRHETRSPTIRRLAVVLAVVLPIGVGLARTYRGMHHLSDVVAGGALGVATLLVGIRCSALAERRGVDGRGGTPAP